MQPASNPDTETNRLARTAALAGQIRWKRFSRKITLCLIPLLIGMIYVRTNPRPSGHFDYQLRIADALLSGRLGIPNPPPWLNEMVPDPRGSGLSYSVFPLGSILCFLPLALVRRLIAPGVWTDTSIGWFSGAIAAGTAGFFLEIAGRNRAPLPRRLMLLVWAMLGTWLWPNLIYGGAWHLALGLAVFGQAGAIYYTFKGRPLAAGALFAVAFGNRTEVLLTAPIYLYLIFTQSPSVSAKVRIIAAVRFIAVPFALGVLTLAYNQARFGSMSDFGYAHIAGVMQETWYRAGIVSLLAVPLNIQTMLLQGAWRVRDSFPYFTPDPMGGSIFGSSPYLFLLFRDGCRNRTVLRASWVATAVLVIALWVHGNQGGWQFSYRYGLVFVPWLFVILTEKLPKRVTVTEALLLAISILLNAFATYLFYWTNLVHV